MKKFRSLFAIILVIAMLSSLCTVITIAEGIDSYSALASAIGAASDGDTITLGGDITDFSAPITVEGKELTIDLNGNDISISQDIDEEEAMFELLDCADVTFTDSSASAGTIDMGIVDTACSAFLVDGDSTLTLEKINVDADQTGYDLICALNGDVIIDSGTYKITYGYFISDDYNIDEDIVDVEINGGTFTGYKSEVNDNRYCASFISLYNANVVIEDCTVSGIDDGVIVCGGSLTVNGGSITAEDNGIYFAEIDYPDEEFFVPMEAEINDCTVHTTYFEAISSYGGNVTVNGGNFTSERSKVVIIGNDENFSEDNEFVINGGTFITEAPQSHDDHFHYNEVAIVTFASEPYQGHTCAPREVIINGGTFTAKYAPAGQFRSDITINGGTFEGLSAGIVIDNYDEMYTFDIQGGLFTARERNADDDTYCPDDDFLGQATGIFGINIDILDTISEEYVLYANNKTVSDTISADYEYDQKAYYTEEKILAVEMGSASILDEDVEVLYKDADDTLFTSDISFQWFKEVKIDGEVLDPSNYDAESGSTDITLFASYLNTLSLGKHTIEIVSDVLGTTLVAETTFEVVEEIEEPEDEEDPDDEEEPDEEPDDEYDETSDENPIIPDGPEIDKQISTNQADEDKIADTADNNMLGFYVALCAISATSVVTIIKKKED